MWQRKNGVWEERVKFGEKTVSFYSSEKTEAKASAEIRKKILAYQEKAHTKKHNFLMLAEDVIREKEHFVTDATLACYNYTLKHLSPFFQKDIEEISPYDLQNILNQMAKEQYGKSAIQKTKVFFGMVLDYAILHGVKTENYMRSIKMPKNVRKSKITSPDDKVIARVSENASNEKFGAWAFILLYTGMRKGELAALQRKDIDFDKGLIHVTKSAEYVGNQAKIKEPKTENGIRSIPILDILLPVLKDLCSDLNSDDYIFGGTTPLSNTMIKKRWDAYCKELGIEIHQHQLRHAYAKLLYRSGVDPKTTQGILGHADVQTTLNIYTDFAKDATRLSMDKVNNYVSQKGTA